MTKIVSIIIPCYNDGKYIREAVASAKAQTYLDVEIIIVDDHSNDPATIRILSDLEKEACLVLKTPAGKKGLPAARNAGIARASGKYILPLDADDKIDPSYLSKAVSVLEKDPSITICGCNVRFFGLRRTSFTQQAKLNFATLVTEEYKLVCSCVYRKYDWERVGGYDESLICGKEDMVFWLDLLANGGKVTVLPEELFFYRIRPRSMTAAVAGAPTEKEKLAALYAARPDIFKCHILDFMEALACCREQKAHRECLVLWKVFSRILKLEWALRQKIKRLFGRA